jgi:acetate---CoA ligase (ADP-forming)
MDLHTLFNPNSVAVIGATNDETKVGYALMKNVLSGRVREVYPITLSEVQVLGHVAYKSITTVPGKIDLAVIAVRADIVASIIEECGQKGITTVIVISAGFKETGPEGKKLEEAIATVAKKYNITLLGPNCLGVMNAQAEWNASFAVDSPRKGNTAFVSQSGALGTALLDWANKEGVGFSKFVSLGNEASLSELDMLEYLADDTETHAVLLYVEKVTDGRRFLELAKRVTAKKPLVVLRAGRSARGQKAVASHTGSLAPSDKVFETALRQVGAIPIESIRTLFSLAKLFELGHTKPLQKLAIVTNGGGPSVNTADLIGFSQSLSLVDFTKETKASLQTVLPPMAAVNNPVDVIGDAGPERYRDVLSQLVTHTEIDAIITLVTPQMMTDPKGIAEVFVNLKNKKPLIPVFMGGNTVAEGITLLQTSGLINFDSPTDVVEALDALAQHAQKPTTEAAESAHEKSLSMLHHATMQKVLGEYNLTLEGLFVEKKEEVLKILPKLGSGPYAIKAISENIVHKSDMKAVHVNLTNEDDVLLAWLQVETYLEENTQGVTIEGMQIQNMVKGVECIVGMKRDAVFGPVIVFGLGGVFVEIVRDAHMRIVPVSKDDALELIHSIQGLPLLTGARGSTPVNLDALAEIIVSLSTLSLEHPEIQEVDFNPVIATSEGAHIVDARLMLR